MSTVEKTFTNGEIIIKEGDDGESFFQIIEGNCAVYKNYGQDDQIKLTVLVPGKYFGEMAVIETYPRSTTVVADGDVKVIEIPGEELNKYFKENPDKILDIMKHLGTRLKELSADYNEACGLFTDIREGGEQKKESVLSKLKKHINFYLAGKGKMSKPSAEAVRENYEAISGEGSAKIESYTKGSIIFKQGEIGKCMYMVHGGVVGIYNNYGQADEVKLSELYPVECFGEIGMISDEPRSATAVAEVDDTYVEIIRMEDLDGLFQSSPTKIDMILRHLSYSLRSLTYKYFSTCKELYDLYNK